MTGVIVFDEHTPHMRSPEEGHWDAFEIYCNNEGISLDHPDDWEWAWRLWNAALDAADQEYMKIHGQTN